MFVGPEQVEAVKAAADLVRVAERYVQGLKKAGGHWTGRCCFHADRSPSLYLYPEDGHYHCFGCGAHGDVIALVQQRAGLSFQEAVTDLAREFGVAIEDRASGGPREDHAGLYRACEFAAAWYEEQLWDEGGEEALTYLASRKLTEDTLRRFRLGWAPGGDGLCVAAVKAGVHVGELQQAGLAVFRDGGLRDVFYRRIIIPITNAAGRPVAFTCRALPVDEIKAKERDRHCPKYVNTGDTPLYTKGRTVFNLHRAKGAARRAERLVIFEGALDVIAADQAGFAEAVAPCGTALTTDQAALLTTAAARHDVYLALDGDQAGQAALQKGARELLAAGATTRVLALPADADPAELLVEEAASPEAARSTFQQLLGQAVPALPWLVQQSCPDANQADEPTRLRVLDEVLDLVGKIGDEDLRGLYVDAAARQLKIPGSAARKRAGKRSAGTSDSLPPGKPSPGARGNDPSSRYPLNETGNAHRFRDRFGDDVRYCHTWGVWLVWLGTHWEIDRTKEVERRMTAAIEASCDDEISALQAEITAEQALKQPSVFKIERLDELIETLTKWKVKNCNDRALINSLGRAASLIELGVTDVELDTDPWLFTVQNGTIDLRTGILRKHQRTDYITRLCPVPFDPTATDARWSGFLDLFTAENSDLAAYLQRAAGYAMSGVTKEDAVWMFAGPGSNGKSTFTAAIQSLLGTYARPLPFELFLTSHSDKRKWSLAEASQCRLVVCEESEEGRRFNASLVKQVTGGTPIEAERKHGNPFSYLPRFKVWFITNNPPTVSDTDHGFWRRLHLVLCERAPAKPDRDLKPYLQGDPQARAAILAWAVAGARAYCEQGLNAPDSVLQANRAYRDEQDPLRPFLDECCTFDDQAQIPVRDLMAAYDAWAESNKVRHKLSNKAISQRLAAKGVQTDGVWTQSQSLRKSVRGYAGIRLRVEADPRPGEAASDVASDADATRGGSEAAAFNGLDNTDDQVAELNDALHSASDAALASDPPQFPGASEADATISPGNDFTPVASDASDKSTRIHEGLSLSPPSIHGERRNQDDTRGAPVDPTSRGARLRSKPSPDPRDEDPFADPPAAPDEPHRPDDGSTTPESTP